MKSLIGKTIKNYQFLKKIRETGISILYKAYDTQSMRNVGVEVITTPASLVNGLFIEIKRQMHKLERLQHSNIATALDCEMFEDFIYCVFDFSPNYPLRRAFNLSFSWKETAIELVAISQALTYAHEKGCFHGALYPGNVVINDEGTPYIFGLGIENCVVNFLITNTPGGWIYNTSYEYMAPELLKKSKMDARTDVYGFGMIVYEWITGTIYNNEENSLLKLLKDQNENLNGKRFRKQIPSKSIRLMIKKCLEINPKKRYQSMQPITILLTRGALDLPITINQLKRPSLQNKRSFFRWWFLLPSIILILACGLTWQYYFPSNGVLYLSEELPSIHIFETPTFSPSLLEILPTQTPTKIATKIPPPTTFAKLSTPSTSPTLVPIKPTYPLFENQDLPNYTDIITNENAFRIVPIAIWGTGKINQLTISPDNQFLAISSNFGLFIYKFPEITLVKSLDMQTKYLQSLFSPDGNLLSAIDSEGLIHIFTVKEWTEYRLFSSQTKSKVEQAFSNDSKFLISLPNQNTAVRYWDIYNGSGYEITGEFVENNSLRSINSVLGKVILPEDVDFSMAASNAHVIAGTDKSISIWKDTLNKVTLFGMLGQVTDVKISPNENMIAAIDQLGYIKVGNNQKEILWTKRVTNEKHFFNEREFKLTFTSDNRYLIVAGSAGMIMIYESTKGEQFFEPHSLSNPVENIRQSGNGNLILSQSQDGIVKIWKYKSGQEISQLDGYIMPGTTFSSDNQFLSLKINNSTVNVFDMTTYSEIFSFGKHQDIKTISFIGNTYLAVGNSQNLRLWSISSGQEIITHKNYLNCTLILDRLENPIVYVTQYNHVILGNNNTNWLCDFNKVNWMKELEIDETNRMLGVGGTSKLEINQHGKLIDITPGIRGLDVIDITFSPDGTLVAASLSDNSIHIWELSTDKELIKLIGHSDQINDLIFTKDGKFLISGSLDGNIRIWGVP